MLKYIVHLAFLLIGYVDLQSNNDTYIGCYIDSRLDRDLNSLVDREGYVWYTNNGLMTIQTCIEYCRSCFYPYAGLQYSSECFCGISYGKHGKANESDCNFYCIGNTTQKCGGLDRLSIYNVILPNITEVTIIFELTSFLLKSTQVVRIAEAKYNIFLYTIDYISNNGQIIISINNTAIYTFNAQQPDLMNNKKIIFLNLKQSQISIYYNCNLVDNKQSTDDSMAMVILPFLSSDTKVTTGKSMFNRAINDILVTYGCQISNKNTDFEVKNSLNYIINQLNFMLKYITDQNLSILNILSDMGRQIVYGNVNNTISEK